MAVQDSTLNLQGAVQHSGTVMNWLSPKVMAASAATAVIVAGAVTAGVLLSKGNNAAGDLNSGNWSCPTSFPGSVFWHSQPVFPNETLLIHAGPWSSSDSFTVQFARLADEVPTFPPPVCVNISSGIITQQPLKQTYYSVAAVIPPSYAPGIFAYRLVKSDGTVFSDWKLANLPEIWFVQGDEAKNASIGGWIGVYGNSLTTSGSDGSPFQPQLLLKSNSTGTIFKLSPSVVKPGNRWAQYFDVGSDVPAGNYFVWYHGGSGGSNAWTQFNVSDGSQQFNYITIQRNRLSTWPANTLDITTVPGAYFGQQLQNAFKNLTTATKGGIVYLPAGVYYLNQTLSIPERVVVRGSGKAQTTIVYNATNDNTVFTGGSFGFESFTFRGYITGTNVCGCSVFSKSRSKVDLSWVKNIDIFCPNSIRPEDRICQTNGYVPYIGIDQSENLVVENVFFEDCSNCVSITGYSNYTRITNVDMNFRGQNVLIRCGRNHVMDSSKRRLLGNYTINGWGAGTQAGFLIGIYCGQSMTRDVYYGNNTSTSQKGLWNDNTVADGKEGWYYGKVNAVNGRNMILNDTIRVPVFQGSNYAAPANYDYSLTVGSIVMIVGGRGMGQYRFLSSSQYDPYTAPVTIDRPWDVEPDQTSFIAISKFKGRILSVNNNFNAEGVHMWHWFSASDVIYADNVMGVNFTDFTPIFYDPVTSPRVPSSAPTGLSYTGGFRYGDPNFPGFHCGAWYNQAINNTINTNSTGLDISFGTSGTPASNSNITWAKEVSFGNIIRENTNPGNRPFTVRLPNYIGSMVVEGNLNTTYISFTDLTSYIVMRGNTAFMKNVTYTCNTRNCNSFLCNTGCTLNANTLLP